MRRRLFLAFFVLFAAGCATRPGEGGNVSSEQKSPDEFAEGLAPVEAVDAAAVAATAGVKAQVQKDVTDFVDRLNGIIQARDYEAWRQCLDPAYLRAISAREFLNEQEQEFTKRSINVKINTVRDYFSSVVVPSRNNARVDDIEMPNQEQVAVYMNRPVGQTLERTLLYRLAREGDTWRIIG